MCQKWPVLTIYINMHSPIINLIIIFNNLYLISLYNKVYTKQALFRKEFPISLLNFPVSHRVKGRFYLGKSATLGYPPHFHPHPNLIRLSSQLVMLYIFHICLITALFQPNLANG